MAGAPLIGMSVSMRLLAGGADSPQEIVYACASDYAREIDRAGGVSLLLPALGGAEAARRGLEAVDGLLLTGGGDIDPALLDEEPHPAIGGLDPERDRYEIALIKAALARGVPILGVCKGAQVLNVALGGGLVQHLDESRPGAVGHRARGVRPCATHTIVIEPGTLLAELMGAGERRVNSHHHQAPGEAAPGLKVSARSRDGVIEALESSEGRPVLGVQFHPERMAPDDLASRALFEWLVVEARKKD